MKSQNVQNLVDGIIRRGCRASLARAITLIESSAPKDQPLAAQLLNLLGRNISNASPALRIGIAGPPGDRWNYKSWYTTIGKSSFIEKLGKAFICNPNLLSGPEDHSLKKSTSNRVAVLPIDPSSSVSGGSILGDKTRMGFLSANRDAFVRAAPSRCILGGLAEHTRDAMSICEAAGYNIVVVETVGLGQSEIDVDLAVDMVILLVSPGGGDALQASKKGIMEIADLIVVNKADGSLLGQANHTAADYSGSLQFIRQKHSNSEWRPQVMLASAATDYNIIEIARKIESFFKIMQSEGRIQTRRSQQNKHWLRMHLQRGALLKLNASDALQKQLAELNRFENEGSNNPRFLAQSILDKIEIVWKES